MPGVCTQHLTQDGHVGNDLTEDQLARDRTIEVVLRHELPQHVGRFGVQRQAGKEIPRAQADAVAEEQHTDAGQARFNAAGDHIHVGIGPVHVILCLQLPQRGHLITQLGGTLELQRDTGLFHCRGQLVDHGAAATFQKHFGMPHIHRVIGHADHADTRRTAAADLIQQTRSRAVVKVTVLALAHLEQFLHQVEAFAHGVGAWIRAEITPRLVARATMKRQPRIILARGQIDVGIAFVVTQQDVVTRLERLDQLRFQQQRLAFRARDRDLDPRNLRHHGRNARLRMRLQEITADALLEVAGLADIQQLTGCVKVAIDPWRRTERVDKGLAVERWRLRGLHAHILAATCHAC